MARPPLTLLVASTSNDQIASFLYDLGARVFSRLNDQVLDIAKDAASRLIVDAVVVDATSIIYMKGGVFGKGDAPLHAAGSLVQDILRLPPWATASNGISWCDLPIFVLVDEPYYDRFARQYPGNASWVTVCKAPFRPSGWDDPYRLSFGWDKVYGLMVQRVKDWTFDLVERMRLRGYSLTEGAGIGRKYKSAKRDYDMRRLAPRTIILASGAKGRDLDMRINLIRWDHAIADVIEQFGEAVKYDKHVREYWFQRLFSENPYLLGAASFELFPHPYLIPDRGDARFPKTQIPDFVRYLISSRRIAEVGAIEIKRADTPPAKLDAAVRQVLNTWKFLGDKRYARDLAPLFGPSFRAARPLVIASLSNLAGFERFRSHDRHADVLGYDKVFAEAERRYTFVPSDDLFSAYG